jgi:hypothetical protein
VKEELKDQLDGCFKKIIKCLIDAEAELKTIESSKAKGRLRILFGGKLGLESKIEELEKQRELFAPLTTYIHLQQSALPPSFLANRIKLLQESENEQAGHLLRTSDIRIARCDMGERTVNDTIVVRRP